MARQGEGQVRGGGEELKGRTTENTSAKGLPRGLGTSLCGRVTCAAKGVDVCV